MALFVALAACGCAEGAPQVQERPSAGAPALRDGPLDAGDDTEASAWVRVGKPVSWGFATLTNASRRPAVLERIDVVGVPPQLEVLAVRVSPADRPHNIGIGRWPVTEVPVGDVQGATVPPAGHPDAEFGLEVIVGLRSRAAGRWITKGLRVAYSVGKDRYLEEFSQVVEICSDEEKCPPA